MKQMMLSLVVVMVLFNQPLWAGDIVADPLLRMQFVVVKGGCFEMGGKNEKSVHKVCVSDFAIGKYEVTQGQWLAIMGDNPSHFSSCGSDCPVERVSWSDAQEFIKKLNSKNGKNYRLPTEAEWEYAARSGGRREKYSGGNDIGVVAWYVGNSGGKTHKVGQKQANALGIYDMSGNVWEWCNDWYDANYYKNSPLNDPQGATTGQYRIMRGGSWSNVPVYVRAFDRYWFYPDYRFSSSGLRLAFSPKD